MNDVVKIAFLRGLTQYRGVASLLYILCFGVLLLSCIGWALNWTAHRCLPEFPICASISRPRPPLATMRFYLLTIPFILVPVFAVRLDYEYFIFIRWLVSGTLAHILSTSTGLSKRWVRGSVIALILLVIFNPIFVVHLSASTWKILDSGVVVFICRYIQHMVRVFRAQYLSDYENALNAIGEFRRKEVLMRRNESTG